MQNTIITDFTKKVPSTAGISRNIQKGTDNKKYSYSLNQKTTDSFLDSKAMGMITRMQVESMTSYHGINSINVTANIFSNSTQWNVVAGYSQKILSFEKEYKKMYN